VDDTKVAKRDLLPNEVYVELDVLRAVMMDGVGGEVDGRDIVAKDNRGFVDDRTVKLAEQLREPTTFGDSIGHCAVFHLGAQS
jgi:hypothetical protein